MRFLRNLVVCVLICWGFIPAHAQFFDPVASNDFGDTDEDDPVSFNITSNDSDPDLLGLINSATVDLDPVAGGQQTTVTNSQGQFTVDLAGNLTYTPALNFN